MSKKHQRATWVLPETVDPPERVCYVVPVPNDRMHIGAFLGAIANLATYYNWRKDGADTNRAVAAVWEEIFDGLLQRSCALIGGDDVQFRQNGCKLEYSVDCVHWNVLYDPTECIAAGSTQAPPDGELAAGECREYTFTIGGNGIYLLPVPVQAGYRVTIKSASGGWNDGSGITGWHCPDGTPYVLGACVGARTHESGDPSAAAWHAEVVAQAGSLFFPASSGVFVIPGTEPSEALQFFMNDASLGDNYGSITLHIEVCAEAPETFNHVFDFSTDDGGWVDAGNGSAFVPDTWWLGGDGGGGGTHSDLYIKREFDARIITSIVVTFNESGNAGSNQFNQCGCFLGAPRVFYATQASHSGSAQEIDYAPGVNMEKILLDYNAGSHSGAVTQGLSVVVSGFGSDPF